MPNLNDHDEAIRSIIEAGLEMAGKQSKEIIIRYISYKYGLNQGSLARYKEEFANYLREILGQSAEVITSKIDKYIAENNIISDKAEKLGDKISGSPAAVAEGSKLQTLVVQHDAAKRRQRISDNIQFLICDSCFWCASLLVSNYPLKCMACGSEIKSPVPIENNEKFTYQVDSKRGVSLSFRS